ncbi:MAG TPA: DUF6445 family protein [Allosphingosinicella sp.]|nr:DUF6445 family protein [Allosphingosinicella sp.]
MAEAMTGPPTPRQVGLNPAARVRTMPVGRSREPVIVVEDALLDPDAAIEQAAQLGFEAADEGRGGFPGVRAQAPPALAEILVEGAMPLIERVFGLRRASLTGLDASFSIVTAPPTALHPMQRIPHIDTRDPRRLAILCYLGRGAFGGTAFFRQDSTGLEQVGPDRFDSYYAARRADLARVPPDGGYPGAGTEGYTETAHFEARFNRLLVYRSCSLHSGIIPSDTRLSADPRLGRLTINIFLDFAPG